MSVSVDIERLRDKTDEFGPLAFVVTVNEDGRAHIVSAEVAWRDDRLVAGAGRRTGANVGERPSVTVLWPPVGDGGFSLLVDGTAGLEGDQVVIAPDSAILHRMAVADDGGRASDCAEV
jgi:Pyridoxamine 5'-phosphate oxidase